jgi:molecular chaperone GrpE
MKKSGNKQHEHSHEETNPRHDQHPHGFQHGEPKKEQETNVKDSAVNETDAAGTALPEPAAVATPTVPQPEYEAMKEKYLRLYADFDNYKKRVQRERIELIKHANEDLISSLLPVLDHLGLALSNAGSHDHADATKSMVDGFKMVGEQLMGELKKYGLEPVNALGQPFNHNLHESISLAPSEEYAEGVVMHQVRRGYTLGEKLLKAAQVVVSSGPANPADSETAAQDGEA